MRELSRRLPDDAIVTGDSGTVAVWLARGLKVRRGMKVSLSGGLASMGSAVPYALAAKLAYPDRPVVALVGDGAMQMSGLNALIGVAERWRSWADPRFAVLVLNNRDLNYVSWEQRAMEGNRRFVTSRALPDFPFAGYAEGLGLRGRRLTRPEEVGPAWDEALAAVRPVVLEAVVSADVPTLPPRPTEQQRRHLKRALEQGDPDRVGVEAQLEQLGLTLP